MQHLIPYINFDPELTADWNSPVWHGVPTLAVDVFHPLSSDHRPVTSAKLLHSDRALHVLFRVQDRYVKSIATNYQDQVCQDSCVELFISPKAGRGYFNFEFNCGGVMLNYYIEDPTRVGSAFRKFTQVPGDLHEPVTVRSTMPRTTPIEIAEPIEWRLEARIPFSLMERFVGPIDVRAEPTWRGNLFKCGSATSHPHWAAWSDVGPELNFHQPSRFGELQLEPCNVKLAYSLTPKV